VALAVASTSGVKWGPQQTPADPTVPHRRTICSNVCRGCPVGEYGVVERRSDPARRCFVGV